MKTVKNLLMARRNKTMGNHRVEILPNGIRKFYFYWTCICEVNDNTKEFKIDASYGSVSTTRACNAYRTSLEMEGYTEVEKDKDVLYWYDRRRF